MTNKAEGGPELRSGRHFPALDGVRGLAILMVLALHLTLMQPVRAADFVVYSLARTGWAGVDLFFVLSGFLITGILYDARGREGALRTFYGRRFLRIFPLYYAFLVAVFLLGPLLAPGNEWLARVSPDQLWHWAYLTNVLVALEGWTGVPHLGHFWSLAIEEQFYLLWPLAVLWLPRRGAMALCGALMAASLAARTGMVLSGVSPIAVYSLTFTRWDGLLVGALIALAGRGPRGVRPLLRWTAPVLLAGIPALAAMVWAHPYRSHYGGGMQTVGYPLLALVFGALLVRVVSAEEGSRLARALSASWLRFFGRYSYGIYLLHVPVMGWLTHAGLSARLVPPLWGSALPGQVVLWITGTVASVGAALVTWTLLERPFLSLKRHFEYSPAMAPPARPAREERRAAA